MKVNLSHDSLRALYLAVRAAQRGDPRVVISNKALQKWLGPKKLHRDRITNLAKKIEPVFYDHLIGKDPTNNGHSLTLYLAKKKGVRSEVKEVSMVGHLLPVDDMCKELGIELI